MKYIQTISTSLAFLACSHMASATLITNGSFEQTTFNDNQVSYGLVKNTNLADFASKQRAWDVFSFIPGWFTSYVSGIEIQKNIVTASHDGVQHIELDSFKRQDSNSMMTQTVDSLVVGQDYFLEFFYKARTNNRNDNGIKVYWQDASLDFDFSQDAVHVANDIRRNTPDWQQHTVSFTATATSMNLSFAAYGKRNTLGGLIDNVSLNQVSFDRVAAVPEPGMIALMLMSLGFLATRKKYSQQTNK